MYGIDQTKCCNAVTLASMIRIQLQVSLRYLIDAFGGDFIFNIHAAQTPSQSLVGEMLSLSQDVPTKMHTDPVTGNRYLRLRALPGELNLSYSVSVDLTHHRQDPFTIPEVPVHLLPPEVIAYLYPSRYCQSDRLGRLAIKAFGQLPKGYARVMAIREWVERRVTFLPNSSNSNTSAADTLIDEAGVCRDFAHLMIALCRAVSIPARFAVGTDYGCDPAMGPPDFHAYVEVYLGNRWYIFDPTGTSVPMGFVRFGTGRDAADAAFATIFGGVTSQAPLIRQFAIEDASQGFELPWRSQEALSTDDGMPLASRA
jgi:transglutaminase-like putative cysteine protease